MTEAVTRARTLQNGCFILTNTLLELATYQQFGETKFLRIEPGTQKNLSMHAILSGDFGGRRARRHKRPSTSLAGFVIELKLFCSIYQTKFYTSIKTCML